MTGDVLRESIDLIKQHSSPIVHPLLDAIEAAWLLDREAIKVRDTQIDLLTGVTGHRVYDDNDRHSRRATDLRSVS